MARLKPSSSASACSRSCWQVPAFFCWFTDPGSSRERDRRLTNHPRPASITPAGRVFDTRAGVAMMQARYVIAAARGNRTRSRVPGAQGRFVPVTAAEYALPRAA